MISGFSRGMRQRLALERALLHNPRLLLLDEPFTGLDSPSGERLEALLARLAGEGRGVLIATHDVEQTRHWERVLYLNRRQIAFGAPDEVLSADVLQRTYGGDIVELPTGEHALAPPHHC